MQFDSFYHLTIDIERLIKFHSTFSFSTVRWGENFKGRNIYSSSSQPFSISSYFYLEISIRSSDVNIFYFHLVEPFLDLFNIFGSFIPLNYRIFVIKITCFDDLISIFFQTQFCFFGHSRCSVHSYSPWMFSCMLFLSASIHIFFTWMSSGSKFFWIDAFELIHISLSDDRDDMIHLCYFPMKKMSRVKYDLIVICMLEKMFGNAIREIFHHRMRSCFENSLL